jgi:hypothetical protein
MVALAMFALCGAFFGTYRLGQSHGHIFGADTEHMVGLEANQASCAINALQAAIVISRAGVVIAKATDDCNQTKINSIPDAWGGPSLGRKSCAVDVTGLIGSFAGVGTILAAEASMCAETANADALCASGIQLIVGAMGAISSSATLMNMACITSTEDSGNKTRDWVKQGLYKEKAGLAMQSMANFGTRDNPPDFDKAAKMDLAQCVINTFEVALTIGQAGMAINSATKDCPALSDAALEAMLGGTLDYTDPKMIPAIEAAEAMVRKQMSIVCTADVAGIIGAFAEIGGYLSLVATQCPHVPNPDAGCAFAIQNTIAAISNLVAAGATIHLTCPKPGQKASTSAEAAKKEVEENKNLPIEDRQWTQLRPVHVTKKLEPNSEGSGPAVPAQTMY